jgi:hypothetical protein
MNKIEKIKESANNKIELLTIKNDIDIEKINLENKLLNSQNKLLNIKHDNLSLKNKNGLFDRLKRSGRVLNTLAIFSFLVSTILSLLSGYNVIKDIIMFVGFGLIMIVCQFIIFISSKYNTITKDKFFHRYTGLKAMQISLLFVSLTLNIMFIHECFNSYLMDIIFFPLCFILDYSTIYFSGLGYDMKTLTFSNETKNLTIFEMLINNLTYNLKSKIIKTYNKNNESKIEVLNDNKSKTFRLNKEFKPLNIVKSKKVLNKNNESKIEVLNDKSKIIEFLIKTYKPDQRIKKFQNDFNLSLSEYRKILEQLKEDNIIYTENKNTYLKPQENKLIAVK